MRLSKIFGRSEPGLDMIMSLTKLLLKGAQDSAHLRAGSPFSSFGSRPDSPATPTLNSSRSVSELPTGTPSPSALRQRPTVSMPFDILVAAARGGAGGGGSQGMPATPEAAEEAGADL